MVPPKEERDNWDYCPFLFSFVPYKALYKEMSLTKHNRKGNQIQTNIDDWCTQHSEYASYFN